MKRTQAHIDTTSRLWDHYYRVKIPYLQSRSIDDVRRHGVNVSGVSAIDNDIHNQWMTSMLTVAQMADYFKEDVPIRVVSQSDVKEIYDCISEHIHAWKTRLDRGINVGDAPVDDLILLDRFANTIYEHAKYQFTPEIANSLMAQHLNQLQRVNASNFFNSNALNNLQSSNDMSGVTRINADKTEYEERDSLGEFFKTRLINLNRK